MVGLPPTPRSQRPSPPPRPHPKPPPRHLPRHKIRNDPAVIFGHDEQGRHGNFHPDSYTNICANPAWLRRLTKPHTASRRSRPRKDWKWHGARLRRQLRRSSHEHLLPPRRLQRPNPRPRRRQSSRVDPATQPCFGLTPGVPLKHPRKGRSKLPTELTDRTEIDLQLGNLFLEAKLTESNFQTASPRLIERYRDLETVFDLDRLPRKTLASPATHPPVEDYSQLEGELRIEAVDVVILSKAKNPYTSPKPPRALIETAAVIATQATRNTSSNRTLIQGYQLIRNVLAAYAAGASFCVLCDARRHDLIETWYSILSAVHSPTFATRLKLLTWQELSTTLPQDLQQFLETKYGISPA